MSPTLEEINASPDRAHAKAAELGVEVHFICREPTTQDLWLAVEAPGDHHAVVRFGDLGRGAWETVADMLPSRDEAVREAQRRSGMFDVQSPPAA